MILEIHEFMKLFLLEHNLHFFKNVPQTDQNTGPTNNHPLQKHTKNPTKKTPKERKTTSQKWGEKKKILPQYKAQTTWENKLKI